MSDWYLGDAWDDATQKEFEQKLKRSRGSHSKAQYLRINGSGLLKSEDPIKRHAGCELLKRVINEYPNETAQIKFSYELLGDYHSQNKKYNLSESYYRNSLSYYRSHGRTGTSGICDIKLAELIIESNQEKKFLEMYELLTVRFPENHGKLILNEDKFRYAKVMAQLGLGLGKNDDAKDYAKLALDLAKQTAPQLANYPKFGVVNVSSEEVKLLESIIRITD